VISFNSETRVSSVSGNVQHLLKMWDLERLIDTVTCESRAYPITNTTLPQRPKQPRTHFRRLSRLFLLFRIGRGSIVRCVSGKEHEVLRCRWEFGATFGETAVLLVVAFEEMGVDFVRCGVDQVGKICWSGGLDREVLQYNAVGNTETSLLRHLAYLSTVPQHSCRSP
jgi:hypothetical protein